LKRSLAHLERAQLQRGVRRRRRLQRGEDAREGAKVGTELDGLGRERADAAQPGLEAPPPPAGADP
jgi:hypothetical protein